MKNQQSEPVQLEMGIGRTLQEKRRAKKVPLKQIAEQLRVRESVLTALEADDYANLPSAVYTFGFIRSYAGYLGLNADELIQRVQESGLIKTDVKYEILVPVEDQATPSKKLVWLVLLAIVVLLCGWAGYLWQSHKDGLPEEIYSLEQDMFSQKLKEEALKLEEKDAEIEAPAIPIEPAPVEEIGEPIVEEMPNVEVVPEPKKVTLVATGEVWFQLREPKQDGVVVVNRFLKEGQSYSITSSVPLVADIGRPEVMEVMIDGKKMGVLGVQGRVLKDLPVSSDYLENVYFGENWPTKPYWRGIPNS